MGQSTQPLCRAYFSCATICFAGRIDIARGECERAIERPGVDLYPEAKPRAQRLRLLASAPSLRFRPLAAAVRLRLERDGAAPNARRPRRVLYLLADEAAPPEPLEAAEPAA